MTTNNAVNTSLSGQTGTGNFVGSTSPSITTGIKDTNGNNWIVQAAAASAVNYVQVGNGATGVPATIQALGSDSNVGLTITSKGNSNILLESNGAIIISTGSTTGSDVNYILALSNSTGNAPIFSAQGTDTNIILQVQGKGTGGVAVQGTSAASPADAAAGYVGEFVSSVVASGSAISLSNNTPANVTSISLTAGDWDVWGNVNFPSVTIAASGVSIWVSSSSATQPDASLYSGMKFATNIIGQGTGFTAPSQRFNVGTGGATIYLSTNALFASGDVTACGGIYARRRR